MNQKIIKDKLGVKTEPVYLLLRAINHLLDKLFAFVIYVLLIVISALVLPDEVTDLKGINGVLIPFAGYLLVLFFYYFVSELFLGRTFAKYVTQTQVVAAPKVKPNSGHIILRTLYRAIPFDDWSIFFLGGQTFHDKFSNTFVAQTSKVDKSIRPSRLTNIVMLIIVAIFFASPVLLLFGWIFYEKLTGGERISIPNKLPADFVLVSAQEVDSKPSDYYEIVYQGRGRTAVVTWQIAGFNFDPKVACSYIRPTTNPYEATERHRIIPSEYTCTNIASNKGKQNSDDKWFEAYKLDQAIIAPVSPSSSGEIANYYLSDPPHRFVIKVTKGQLTEQEVLEMFNSGIRTVPINKLSQ